MVQDHEIEMRQNPPQEYAFLIDDRADAIPKERRKELEAMITPDLIAACRQDLKAAGLWK